ncbi:MAG: aminotransferase class V-fold PLP-dependent enzyme [Pseudomonadota bacterium]
MTIKRGHAFLQNPGPTPVPEEVLQAMHRQPMDLNDPDFTALLWSCFEDLKPVFKTVGDVYAYTANGHGAWEAALVNCFSPGDKLLVPETGNFSLGWSDMARSLDLEVIYLESDWRQAVEPARIEAALKADQKGEIKGVLAVQIDTASGVTSDIPAMRAAIDAARHPALFMVDVIASLGVIDFRMDDWGVDVAVAASQKGLMTPPGLAFTAANERALAITEGASLRRTYFDWSSRQSDVYYRWFCGTPPSQLMFGLRQALDMVAEEGLDQAFARHRHLAGAVHAAVAVWAQAGALDFNAVKAGERAHSVTPILVSSGHDPDTMRTLCRNRFSVALGAGLGRLAGRSFRIGHMGHTNAAVILGALAGVEAALKQSEIPCGVGGVSAAIDHLATVLRG